MKKKLTYRDPAVTGSTLYSDILSAKTEPIYPLIDQFIYEQTSTIISGDPGQGKSIITAQMVMSLITGKPLFGSLDIIRPRNVYYLQMEGSYRNALTRIFEMNESYQAHDADWDRLFWKVGEGLNLCDETAAKSFLRTINEECPNVDLVIIDPIYKAVYGDLKNADVSSAITSFSSAIMNILGASVLMLHHSHRIGYSKINGKKIEEDDPFYGSQFIKAHVDLSYHLTDAEEGEGTCLKLKKDRERTSMKFLELDFHPETLTNTLINAPKVKLKDKVIIYLKQCKEKKKNTTFNEVLQETGATPSYLRELQRSPEITSMVKFLKSPGKATQWILDGSV